MKIDDLHPSITLGEDSTRQFKANAKNSDALACRRLCQFYLPAAPDHVVRTVTENSRTLKFTSQKFERE
ncbi:MAG: hypothetical protein WA133_05415 [Syntrophales bacterium]